MFKPMTYHECKNTDCRYCEYQKAFYKNQDGYDQCKVRDAFREDKEKYFFKSDIETLLGN